MLRKNSGLALRRRALAAALAGLGLPCVQAQDLPSVESAAAAPGEIRVLAWNAPTVSYLLAAADLPPADSGSAALSTSSAHAVLSSGSVEVLPTASASVVYVAEAPAEVPAGAAVVAAASIAPLADPPATTPAPATAETIVPFASDAPSGDWLNLKADLRLLAQRPSDAAAPAFVQGLKISGETGKATLIEGDAELRKRGSNIKADRIAYDPLEDRLRADGNVRIYREGDLFTGTALDLKLDAQTGVFLKADYLLANDRARGTAEKFEFLGKDSYRAEDAVYTTCGPGNDDWFMQVKELKLDYGRSTGEVKNAQLNFMGATILSVPAMSFALNGQRKSGLLAPSFGSTVQSGQEFSMPYYWNIAPNRDMTITPRYMTRRGLQTNLAGRFIGDGYQGEARLEWLPNDKLTQTNRTGFSLLHRQVFGGGWSGNLNVNKVSDDDYFTDLSSRISQTSQRTLVREGTLNYASTYYGVSTRVQSYQVLQDRLNPITEPYHRVPQVTLSARRFDVGGFDLNLAGEFTRFTHPTQVMGNRVVTNPSISYPWLTPGGYLTPKLALHTTKYFLQQQLAGVPDGFTRTLPQFSLDGGLVFERDATYFGQNYTQTLEPRFYYLRVPTRDQSRLPVFDTAIPDLNFAQIFTDNIYSGVDRIADANQVTVGFTSRLIGNDKANERMRFAFAQRIYFSDQDVTLPGEPKRVDRTSDFLASVSGEVAPKLLIDTALQYNPNRNQTGRLSVGARWNPEPGKTFSAAYRFRRDSLEQVDFASQWKFGNNWYGVGRYNFSLREGKVVEALAGVEYDGGCWVGRVVVQRFATATDRSTTSLFFQIELNGLSRLGANPLDQLRRNIPGYSKLNEHQTLAPRTMERYE